MWSRGTNQLTCIVSGNQLFRQTKRNCHVPLANIGEGLYSSDYKTAKAISLTLSYDERAQLLKHLESLHARDLLNRHSDRSAAKDPEVLLKIKQIAHILKMETAHPIGPYCPLTTALETPHPHPIHPDPFKKAEPERPSLKILYQTAAAHSLPFIGFGMLDNAIMITAGDIIDTKIGALLGISTLAAAGLGNIVSDVAGIGSAHYVEAFAMKLGVRPPRLTRLQMDMSSVRVSINIGRAIGVIIGCIIGMFPLLLIKEKSRESNGDEKQKKE
ncbi:unnamed protein product [Cyprideis torosa]|uniref:Uncharacterized protein n=1 Tax=Cyprideis torosa TaxID=163714 RepID=A0A7R8W584_9CRUS|nr:unnamed protein product [Cyprideis torosa]CAG0879557.1 unnamed protein product [Cyprideis torosa]